MSTSAKDQPLFWAAAAGIAAVGASFAARSILSRSWERAFDEPAPRNPGHADVPVSRALMWAMASAGVAAGARLAARTLTARIQDGFYPADADTSERGIPMVSWTRGV